MSQRAEQYLKEIGEIVDGNITHMRRTQLVVARLLGVIKAYHQLGEEFISELPVHYLDREVKLLELEAEALEDFGEVVGLIGQDSRAVAELLAKMLEG